MYKKSLLTIVLLLFFTALAYAGWTPEVRISEPGGCLYPQILAHGDTLHVAYTNGHAGDKISYVRSTDGGLNWSEYLVLSDTVNSNLSLSPIIIRNGDSLLVFWENVFNQGHYDENIGYSISTNNGISWYGPNYILPINLDLIVDFTASGIGETININYTRGTPSGPFFYNVRSTNFSADWSEAIELFQSTECGTMDMTAYGDYFHFVWSGNFNENDTWETYYIRSTDGGGNWSDNIALVDLDGEASFWPSLDVDESGALVFCWTDYKNSPNWFTGDVFIKQSLNNGAYWTSEQQISFTHFSLWTDVCRYGDSIYVAWDDERYGAVGRTIYFVKSLDGGSTWTDEFRIEYDTNTSSTPALAASEDYIYLIWSDYRCDPDTNICGGIYFTRYEVETTIYSEYEGLTPEQFTLSAYPNPFNSHTIITYKNLKGGEIEIFNLSGQKIRTFKTVNNKEGQIEWDARDALGNKVSTGIYFARARAPQNSNTLKLLYLR